VQVGLASCEGFSLQLRNPHREYPLPLMLTQNITVLSHELQSYLPNGHVLSHATQETVVRNFNPKWDAITSAAS
jgi:hypothetical protein